MTVSDQLRTARKVSTPIVAITTADPPATVAALVREFSKAGTLPAPAIVQHDIIRGVAGLNDEGKAARAKLVETDGPELPGTPLQSPAEAMAKFAELPERALVFIHNANRLLQDAACVQAVCNLRDLFKGDGRTLILLSPEFTMPAELVQDVFPIDEPLPTQAEIGAIMARELESAQRMTTPPEKPDEDTLRRAGEALSGLAAFPAEQSFAMTLAMGRVDLPFLWTRKRGYIQQTKGLSMDSGGETFEDLGGLEHAKQFGREIFNGPEPPAVIVRIDEIEKMLAGAAGDTSGTSQDQLGTILREMEDQDWVGLIAVGPPGSGKSIYSKTLGNTFKVPTFAFDLGAAKGSLVGQSEERIRSVMKVIRAVAGRRAYFTATCNDIEKSVIKPELLRRFADGIWFFDLPTVEEKASIWPINLARFGHALDSKRPDDDQWTGAEIRNCCRLAYRRRCSLIEAAKSIVPVAKTAAAQLNKLRETAHGNFLSASYEGPYKHAKAPNAPPTVATSTRRDYSQGN